MTNSVHTEFRTAPQPRTTYVEKSRVDTFFPHTLEEMRAAKKARDERWRLQAAQAQRELMAPRQLLPAPRPPPEPAICAPELSTSKVIDTPHPFPKIELIQAFVAAYYGISRADLTGDTRFAKFVRPRQVAMYLAYMITPKSFPTIGRLFGGRDHTTALHAVNKVRRLIETNAEVAETIALLKADWPAVARYKGRAEKSPFTVPQQEALRILPADGSWARLEGTRGGAAAAQSLLRCHKGLVEWERRTASHLAGRYRLTADGIAARNGVVR